MNTDETKLYIVFHETSEHSLRQITTQYNHFLVCFDVRLTLGFF